MQKYVFLKLDLKVKRQYFRYKEYINWLQIDEILTYVFMYLTRFLAWKRVFAIFLHRGTTCL